MTDSEYATYLKWNIPENKLVKQCDLGMVIVWQQTALLAFNLDKLQFTSDGNNYIISWEEELIFQCMMNGNTLVVSPGSVSGAGNAALVVSNLQFPISDSTVKLSLMPYDIQPDARNLLIGAVIGGDLLLRPSASKKSGGGSLDGYEIVEFNIDNMAVLSGGKDTYNYSDFKNIEGFRFHSNPGPLRPDSINGAGRVQATMPARPGMSPSTKFRFRVFCTWEDHSWSGNFDAVPIGGANLDMQCQVRIIEHDAQSDFDFSYPVVVTGSTRYTFPADPRRSEGLAFAYPWSSDFSIGGLNEEMLIAFEFADVDSELPAFPWEYHGYRFLLAYKG